MKALKDCLLHKRLEGREGEKGEERKEGEREGGMNDGRKDRRKKRLLSLV